MKERAMSERIERMLLKLLAANRTVVDSTVRMNLAHSEAARADLVAEIRWAQARRDEIYNCILAEFEQVTAERDELTATLQPFAYLAEVMKEGKFLNFKGVYVSWEQAQAAAEAIAKARGEP